MKKQKFNGKGAEECKAVDWSAVSQTIEKKGKPVASKKDDYKWDIDDVEETWSVDFDENGRKIEASAKKKTGSAKSSVKKNVKQPVEENGKKPARGSVKEPDHDDLGDSIVFETLDQIAREGILRADGEFVTGEIDAKAVNSEVNSKDNLKSDSKANSKGDLKSDSQTVPKASSKKNSANVAAGSKKSRPQLDEESIRKSVDEKIIIKSEELKGKRDKGKKQVKVRVPKEDAGVNTAYRDKKGLDKYKKLGELPSRTDSKTRKKENAPSQFRKNSADWRYEGTPKADVTDQAIEETVDNETLLEKIKKFTPVQYIALAMAVVILITSVMTTAVYADYRSQINKEAAFALLPKFVESDTVAYDEGYAEEEIEMEEAAAEPVNEEGKMLSLVLTSVEKDLKIKLVDEDDTLVKDVLWAVAVTDSDGDESQYEDEDLDGIIHLTDIKAGDYSVAIVPGQGLEGYSFPTIGQQVSVKAKVEYKVIANIKDEIKKESEVNAALEDNGNKAADVETGEALQDTVTFVESREEATSNEEYEEAVVDLSKTEKLVALVDRIKTAAINLSNRIKNSFDSNTVLASVYHPVRVADNEENGSSESSSSSSSSSSEPGDNSQNASDSSSSSSSSSEAVVNQSVPVVSASINKTTATIGTGEKLTLSVSYNPSNATPDNIKWASLDPNVASVADGVVTGVSVGSTKVGAIINNIIAVYCDVTVLAGEASISISGLTSVNVGETIELEAVCTPDTESIKEWKADSNGYTSVTSNGNKCTVKGEKAGEAVITAINTSGGEATFKVTVTEGKTEYSDDAQLYDSSKNKLYVLENNVYRLAKYADYKSGNFTKFYRKIADVVYTGWQTIDGVTYYFTENHEKVTGDQVIGGVTYHFGEDGALKQGSGILGIDVSKYQPDINWSSVKASGINYVIIRCGYRGASTGSLIQDPCFVSHINGAKSVGLKVGVYFFSTALTEAEAVEEASMCAALCSGYGINYPVFIDVEPSSRPGYNGLSVEQRTANIKAFCSTISSAGYTPGLYANKTWLTSYINTSSLSCKIWLAQYNAAGPTYTGHYDIWQYTSKGTVDGISGNVDKNQSYLGY